jgi:hypothetical protein
VSNYSVMVVIFVAQFVLLYRLHFVLFQSVGKLKIVSAPQDPEILVCLRLPRNVRVQGEAALSGFLMAACHHAQVRHGGEGQDRRPPRGEQQVH